jgi:hypothetical protein
LLHHRGRLFGFYSGPTPSLRIPLC